MKKKFLIKKLVFNFAIIAALTLAAVIIFIGVLNNGGDDTFEISYLGAISVDVGESKTINYTVTNEDAVLTFAIEDTAIATVADGVVTGISAGTTKLTLSARYGSDTLKKYSYITVEKGLEIEASDITTSTGMSESVEYIVYLNGGEYANADITMEIADTNIAELDQNQVVALSAGETTLTLTASAASRTKSVTISIKVQEGDSLPVMIDNKTVGSAIELSAGTHTMQISSEESVSVECDSENITITEPTNAAPSLWQLTISASGEYIIRVSAGSSTRTITITVA